MSVSFINPNPNVQVLGVARMTVKSYGVTPNNQVVNIIIV